LCGNSPTFSNSDSDHRSRCLAQTTLNTNRSAANASRNVGRRRPSRLCSWLCSKPVAQPAERQKSCSVACANSRTKEGIMVNTHQVGFMNAQLLITVCSIGLVLPLTGCILDHETARSAWPPQSQKAFTQTSEYRAIRESP